MIKFCCSIEEVKNNFPIIKSQKIKFDWVQSSAKCYRNAKLQNPEVSTGVAKCSGIRELLETGFVLRSWVEISILTTEDPVVFQYAVPEQQKYDFDIIKWFSGDVPQVAIPMPDASLQTLIKINTPWTVELPSDWSLLIIPIPYPDDPHIEATSGILTGPGTYEINPIIKIHKRPGLVSILQGTPLCQLIPIKNESCDVDIV